MVRECSSLRSVRGAALVSAVAGLHSGRLLLGESGGEIRVDRRDRLVDAIARR
jgi:hypothetical protein